MKQAKWKPVNLHRMDTLFFLAVVCIFLLQILLLFTTSLREANIRTAYLAPLIVVMMLYLLMRLGLPRTPVLWLPPVFAVWYLLTRILNGDWYLANSHSLVYMILLACYVLYLAPFLAGRERREKFLRSVALVYSAAFGIIAWIAVIAALTGNPWVNPLDGLGILGIDGVYNNPYRLNVLGIHPNISAIFFYTSLALLAYLFFCTRKIWLRAGYGVLGIGAYLAICMTGSISSIIATAVIVGLLVFALLFHSAKLQKRRILLAVIAMLMAVILVVASYPFIIRWTTAIYSTIQEKSAPFGSTAILAASAPVSGGSDAQADAFADNRLDIDSMAHNMADRFNIYASTVPSIASRPITLLIGELWPDAMARSAKLSHLPVQNHMHNAYLQTLLVGGGISVLLALAFTVLLLLHSARLFFSRIAPMRLRVLVLAPVGMLCHSMTESFLFVDNRIPNLLFFYLAGMIVAFSSEIADTMRKRQA